ncbi:MAG: hypothetical protein JXA30_11295 [Deltaproteobacteria bacterium]|nr:hypothetical protein [Deltaproteobacteria bacterium]
MSYNNAMGINWSVPRCTDDEILTLFKDHVGLVGIDRTRFSRLFCEQLVHIDHSQELCLFAVTDILQELEKLKPEGQHVKNPGQFKHLPLRGLMHIHFGPGHFIHTNLMNEQKRPDNQNRVEKAIENAQNLDDAIKLFAHEMTFGSYKRRADRNGLTGEWIIYAKYDKRNYYLSLASHDETDQVIYDRMVERCEDRFREVLITATTRLGS